MTTEPPSLPEAWFNFKREIRHRIAEWLAVRLAKMLDETPADTRLFEALIAWMEEPESMHRAYFDRSDR
jgi:hypothetical protein